MGYTTKFTGEIALSRPLTVAETAIWFDWENDQESAPRPCPDSYLQWVPTPNGQGITWDGGEKFYLYEEWLRWICAWLKGLGIDTGGQIAWDGEEQGDVGLLIVKNSVVTARKIDLNSAVNRQPIVADLPEMTLAEALAPGVAIADPQQTALEIADLREQVAQLQAMNEKLNQQAVRDAARITDLRAVLDTTVYERNILLADTQRLRKIESAEARKPRRVVIEYVASHDTGEAVHRTVAFDSLKRWLEESNCIPVDREGNEIK